jgi:hypothetical protein
MQGTYALQRLNEKRKTRHSIMLQRKPLLHWGLPLLSSYSWDIIMFSSYTSRAFGEQHADHISEQQSQGAFLILKRERLGPEYYCLRHTWKGPLSVGASIPRLARTDRFWESINLLWNGYWRLFPGGKVVCTWSWIFNFNWRWGWEKLQLPTYSPTPLHGVVPTQLSNDIPSF